MNPSADRAWLATLPSVVEELCGRWGLVLQEPFPARAAWVAPARTADGSDVVLKIGMPHFEAEGEILALRFLDGEPTVRLLSADVEHNAMVLERCRPGTPLSHAHHEEQDIVLADLLRRLWQPAEPSNGFRPLSAMLSRWATEAWDNAMLWSDAALVREGLALFAELPRTAAEEVLLATDLHAGNVLKAERQPWLVIDPKPFVGDPAYDATQHLLNGRTRLRAKPDLTIGRFADLLDVDAERVRLWLFARAAAAPWGGWREGEWLDLARILAP